MNKKVVKYLVSLALVVVAAFVVFTNFKKNTKSDDVKEDLPSSSMEYVENESLAVNEIQDEQNTAAINQAEDIKQNQQEEKKGAESPQEKKESVESTISETGYYYSKDDVALFIHVYGRLPDNFITKSEAQELGWSSGIALSDLAEGMVIGGDRFYNREGVLPKKSGRKYTECDIDTLGKKSRGKKRIVFSNEGQVYYTGDHYESFDLLYGEE